MNSAQVDNEFDIIDITGVDQNQLRGPKAKEDVSAIEGQGDKEDTDNDDSDT